MKSPQFVKITNQWIRLIIGINTLIILFSGSGLLAVINYFTGFLTITYQVPLWLLIALPSFVVLLCIIACNYAEYRTTKQPYKKGVSVMTSNSDVEYFIHRYSFFSIGMVLCWYQDKENKGNFIYIPVKALKPYMKPENLGMRVGKFNQNQSRQSIL